jgi:hypothetical protein
MGTLDKGNKNPTDRRTRGKQVDYTKVGLDNDKSFEAGEEASKEKKGAPVGPQSRSARGEQTADIEEGDEGDDDEEEGEYGEDEDDTEDYDDEDDEE